jgi:plasmid stabilization system protein ParE
MSYVVVLLPLAAQQAATAVAWWRANRPSAPFLLDDELAHAITRLAQTPNAGTRVRRRDDMRRILLTKTGYTIIYQVLPRAKRVEVMALWHGRRGGTPPLR